MNLVIPHLSQWILGVLCVQLLLQFYSDSFKTYMCLCHDLKKGIRFGFNIVVSKMHSNEAILFFL